jgi:hypothetical protein
MKGLQRCSWLASPSCIHIAFRAKVNCYFSCGHIVVHLNKRSRVCCAIFAAVCSAAAYAGDLSWTLEKVGTAINRKNVDVITPYAPTATIAPGSRITHVQASRSYKGSSRVESYLCWNGTTRCVPMSGSSVNTKQFNGLAADKPVFLVHRAVGDKDGPLPSPVFVKGSVIVWYAS